MTYLPEKLLTRAEVAQVAQVSTKTIDRLRANGSLPSVLVFDRLIRFRPEDVDRTFQPEHQK